MRGLIGFLAKLYPPRWRQRYGAEFDTLLDDTRPDAKTALNVFSGAMSMQIRTWSFVKILAAGGLAGVLVAVAIAAAVPKRYVAKSVLKFTSSSSSHDVAVVFDNMASNIISSRSALTKIVTNRDLYRTERAKMPVEDVIAKMNKSIWISPAGPDMFAIQFEDSDPVLAQGVTNDLVRALIDANVQRKLFSPDGTNISALLPTLRVLDPASLPQRPVFPNRVGFAVAGLAGGLLLGAVFAFFLRRTLLRVS